MMSKYFKGLVATIFLFPGFVNAQLVVDPTVTATQAVQNILLGAGVTVSNITFTGDANQIGSFDATQTVMGLSDGVILSSGDINGAIGPNNSGGLTLGGGNFGVNDPDLDIIANASTNDAAILEFDFVPAGDTIEFQYQFGSEEYLEFVNSGFNDAFGFFLSGPGITGPYSNNAINLAEIPGSGGMGVTIDNVNPGSFPAFYVDNGDGSTAPYNTGNQYIQYDGYTVVMTAKSAVQCGQTYHIKICIADAGDTALDSGVFLEAGSFSSEAVQVDVTTVTGDSTIIEGCGDAVFTFTRPDTSGSYTVEFVIGGNASNGSDYVQIPDSVTFQSGEDSTSLVVTPLTDTMSEGADTLTITVYTINACGDTIISTGTVYILDIPNLQVYTSDTTLTCQPDSILITASATGGEPPMTYNWNTGQSGDSIWVQPGPGVTEYIVTVTEGCTLLTVIDTVTVTANFVPLEVTASADTTVQCPGDQATLTAQGSGGVPPYNYSWSSGGNGTMEIVSPGTTTSYVVSITDSCGQATVTDTVVVYVPEDSLGINVSDTTVLCAGDSVWVPASAFGGSGPYTYNWSNGTTDDTLNVQANTTQTYLLTVTDGCGRTTDSIIDVIVPVYGPISVSSSPEEDTVCLGLGMNISASASGGSGTFTYAWDIGGVPQSGNPVLFTPENSGTIIYTVVATDQCGNVGMTDSVVVVVPCEINVPNVFTPNGDGLNETFFIENIQFFEYSRVEIYNRWGQKLYEASPYLNDWVGEGHPDGTYYYIVTVRNGEKEQVHKGSLTKVNSN